MVHLSIILATLDSAVGRRGCSDSEAGSYSRLIDFVYHSTLVIKKKVGADDWWSASGTYSEAFMHVDIQSGDGKCTMSAYRGTSLMRKHPPPRTDIGSWA